MSIGDCILFCAFFSSRDCVSRLKSLLLAEAVIVLGTRDSRPAIRRFLTYCPLFNRKTAMPRRGPYDPRTSEINRAFHRLL